MQTTYTFTAEREDGTVLTYSFESDGDIQTFRYHNGEFVRADGWTYIEDVQYLYDNGKVLRGDVF